MGPIVTLPRDVLSLITNRVPAHTSLGIMVWMKGRKDQWIENKFLTTFGEIKDSSLPQPDIGIKTRLLSCADKSPNYSVYHNLYNPPVNFWERWKWILGIENSLDTEVHSIYRNGIAALENTQATTILQLQHQYHAFWHFDSFLSVYENSKTQAQAEKINSVVKKILCFFLKGIFKIFYKSVITPQVVSLETRSESNHVKIGNFTLDRIDYDVYAFHRVSDIEENIGRHYSSSSYGKTWVWIAKKNNTSFRDANHHIAVSIFRNLEDPFYTVETSGELLNDHGRTLVSNRKRELYVGNDLEYRDASGDPRGSDRSLDQKLTQIMIEIAMQNHDISRVFVDSCRADLPVLVAAGFEFRRDSTEKISQEIRDFRSQSGNQLFPPARDYSSRDTIFKTENFANENVFFSRDEMESWSQIIERAPILKTGAGILPEYWAKKPNIAE